MTHLRKIMMSTPYFAWFWHLLLNIKYLVGKHIFWEYLSVHSKYDKCGDAWMNGDGGYILRLDWQVFYTSTMFLLKHPTLSGQAEWSTEWLEVHGSILNWLIGSPLRQSHTKARTAKPDSKLFFRKPSDLKKRKYLKAIGYDKVR